MDWIYGMTACFCIFSISRIKLAVRKYYLCPVMIKNNHVKKEGVTGAVVTMLVTGALLSLVQVMVRPPLLLAERLLPGGGWLQVVLAALFGGWLYLKMFDRAKRAVWRRRIWLLFSVVFFFQLALGIFADTVFLMSGKLHFPIPGLIPVGVFYRGEMSFMPFLFLSTILLSGGAWCSQLCYFGAWDSLAAGKNGKRQGIKPGTRAGIRWTVLAVFILVALGLRLFHVPVIYASLIAAFAGVAGVGIIVLVSRGRKIAAHCSTYCPAGTLVSYLKYISPWRFRVNDRCTRCMACARVCRYDALPWESILKGRPAVNCTLCGDCLAVCRHGALEYRFWGLSPLAAERLWLGTTLVFFICFLSIARV